jgi:hypothetical protein
MPALTLSMVREVIGRLQEFDDRLRDQSYFDFSPEAREELRVFQDLTHIGPRISSWTFIPHPDVLRHLFAGEEPLSRYIVTIDALRSSVYAAVKDYLQSIEGNVVSFFTGGWADFLCDIQLQRSRLDLFLKRLEEVLLQAGLEKFATIEEVISVFEMVAPVVIAGKQIDRLPRPSNTLLERLYAEKATFEVVLADYRSEAAAAMLGGERGVREYLTWLQNGGAIVAYRAVCDMPSWVQHDYVPMILGIGQTRATLSRFLDVCQDTAEDRSPIVDLFGVRHIRGIADAQTGVNYFCINRYSLPLEKHLWKERVYAGVKVDVNLYNYPIEGTLNDNPLYLSDVPKIQGAVQEYEVTPGRDCLVLGYPDHPLLGTKTTVGLELKALSGHLISLGDPGSGKTNTDLVLAAEASSILARVIILDSSGSVSGKRETLPSPFADSLETIRVTMETIGGNLKDLILAPGNRLLELRVDDMPLAFQTIASTIEDSPDATIGNREREVQSLLLIEEAAGIFGATSSERAVAAERLIKLLSLAYRKGWCIALSAQRPSMLGPNKKTQRRVLSHFGNRFIGVMTNREEVEILADVFQSDHHEGPEIDYFKRHVGRLTPGSILLRGLRVSRTAEKGPLSLLKTRIRLLGDNPSPSKPQSA